MVAPRSLSLGCQRNSCPGMSNGDRHRRAHLSHILDLFAEDNRLNVYAGELEVRPPGAPTTPGMLGWSAKVVLTGIDVLVMKGDWIGALYTFIDPTVSSSV